MRNRRISAGELHDLLLEAAETERRLPPALKKTPGAWWPDIVPGWMAYAPDKTSTRLAQATGTQIDNYDFVLEVVASVDDVADRSLLWAVASSAAFRDRGPGWSKIARIRNTNRRKVKNIYERVLFETAMNWNHAVSW